MDPLTHIMGGAVVAHLVSGSVPEPVLSLTAMSMGIVPDLDFFSRKLPGATFLKVHHGATHSFSGILLQAAVVSGAAFGVFHLPFLSNPHLAYFPLFAVALLAGLTHIFLDWVMHNNGLPLLWPFSPKRFALPLILGVNPNTVSLRCGEQKYLTCLGCQSRGSMRNPVAWIVTVGGLMGFVMPAWRHPVGWYTVLATTLCLAGIGFLRYRAQRVAVRFEPAMEGAAVFPARARPDRWLLVKEMPGGAYIAMLVDSISEAVLKKWNFTPPLVSSFVRSSAARVFADLENAIRFVYPYVVYKDGITSITFRDLSFLYAEPLEVGSVKVQLDAEGAVISEKYQEVWG